MDGWSVKNIQASLNSCDLDKSGNLTLTFAISPESKYDAMPLSDIKGRLYSLDISTASKRVFAGKDGIEEARQRVANRKAGRGVGDDPNLPLTQGLADL